MVGGEKPPAPDLPIFGKTIFPNKMSNKINMPKPLTEEERRQQAMRLVAQKYESFLNGAVYSMLQNPAFDPMSEAQCRLVVKHAKVVADAMMDALYKPKEDQGE